MLAGFAISGTLTLTPTSLGVASGSVTVTLPGVLGGGTGTLSFTTTTGGGLSNLTVQVPSATFMQLFSLSNLTLGYTASSGTWNITGTATTGGGTSTSFGGSMVYNGNTLTSASLNVGAISLAGLLNLSKLQVSYKSGVWSGGATLTQGTQQATVSLTFNNNTGTLAAGELKTGPVSLFGAVQVKSFDLAYDGTNWNLDVTSTLSGGGTATASLKVANGIISSASVTLTDFSLLGKITISSAALSYSAAAPNSQCPTVTGAEIWCGSWAVSLPNATVVSGLGGTLAFANGAFASGSVTVNGNVALLDGVFLTQLGASLTVNPPPTTISGSATVSFGPQVSGTSVLSLAGTLTRVFKSGTSAGSYAVDGTVTALAGSSHSLVLGSANVTVSDSGTSTFTLTLGGSSGLSVSAGGATATITGVVKGTFTGSTFTITGSTSITVPVLGTLSGNLKADNTGIASCAKTSNGTQVGFEYYWSTGAIDVFDSKGCSERGF
jgi:hypothetical protein